MTENQKRLEKLWENKFELIIAGGNEELVNKVKDFMKVLEENKYHGMFKIPDEVYHLVPGISKGQLDDFNELPLKYYHKHFVEFNHEPTDPMKIGSMIHNAVLDPEGLANKYMSNSRIISGLKGEYKKPTSSNEYKDAKANYEKSGYCVISDSDYNMALDISSKVLELESVKNIQEHGYTEVALFSIDTQTGLLKKQKSDGILPANKIIWDLKSSSNAKIDEFQKSIANFRYHVQAAYYLDIATEVLGGQFDKFAWTVAEKVKPYPIANYYCDEAALEKGRIEYRKNINELADCLEKDCFPSYSEEFEAISIPHWAF